MPPTAALALALAAALNLEPSAYVLNYRKTFMQLNGFIPNTELEKASLNLGLAYCEAKREHGRESAINQIHMQVGHSIYLSRLLTPAVVAADQEICP